MRAQADFADGQIMFSPIERPPPNMRRLQSAMFMGRPDLWPVNGRRRSKPVPPQQQPLFDSEDTPGWEARHNPRRYPMLIQSPGSKADDTITALEQSQETLLRWLTTAKVTSPQDQRQAEDLLISARLAYKEAEGKRMELTRPLDQAKANIIQMFKPYLDRLHSGITALTGELNIYRAHLIQLAQAEAARHLEEQARQLADSRDTGEVVELAEAPDVPLVPKTSRANLGTVTYREDFDIQIVDPYRVPRDLCEPCISRIRARVKSGVTEIPGILVTRKTIAITRR